MAKEFSPGVYVDDRNRRRKFFSTLNLAPGKSVYAEKFVKDKGKEYRVWDAHKSKLCASLHKGIYSLPSPGDVVLYLGASTGTTVSHVSDIVGKDGLVFAVETAARVARELVFLAKDRSNIAPIFVDANKVDEFESRLCLADWMFMDIAQRHQVQIFLRNVENFLKPGGMCCFAVKARSISAVMKPNAVFNEVKHQLKNSKKVVIVSQTDLDPYQKDHMLFICKKK